MKQYRFHSELACNEVWYRLNILLQNFPVWGPKRYEISGELTRWGCYLQMKKAGGHGGMRIPLRLWTKEHGEVGCVICCCVFPHKNQLMGLLSAVAFLGLDVFFAELESNEDFFDAVGMSVLICLIAACILCVLFWSIPWLFSRKYNTLLLDWVRLHLLSRELEGILLPGLEIQRESWAGLPEARQVKRLPYVFHSALPPEEIVDAMEQWVKDAGDGIRLSLKWRGTRLSLSGGIYEGEPGGKSWTFSDLFRGYLEPDIAGGSILRGAFVPHPLFLALRILLFAVLGFILLQGIQNPLLLVLLLPAAYRSLYGVYKKPSGNRASLSLLEFLQTYFQEV